MAPHSLPRAVVFDWDNTLVDSWPVIQDALNTTFRAYNLPEWSLTETRQKVRKSMRDSFPAIFGDEWEKAGEIFLSRYEEIHAELITGAVGAYEVIQWLYAQDVYLAIVSNKTGAFLRTEVENLGWTHAFGMIIGANDAEKDKPDPAPVHMALEPSGLEPGRDVWFVGDADIDLICGRVAGCLPILVRPEPPIDGEFPEAPPELHFSDCRHLCNFFRSM